MKNLYILPWKNGFRDFWKIKKQSSTQICLKTSCKGECNKEKSGEEFN